MKSFRQHAKEIMETDEPSPEAVKRTKRIFGVLGGVIFVVGFLGLVLASC